MEGHPLRSYAQWLRLPKNVQKSSFSKFNKNTSPTIIENVSKTILGQDLIIICHVFLSIKPLICIVTFQNYILLRGVPKDYSDVSLYLFLTSKKNKISKLIMVEKFQNQPHPLQPDSPNKQTD